MGLEVFPQPPLIRTRYPVLLMHGFGILGGLRRGGHLHDEAMHLRLHGVLAYAPNVASYNTVAVRATMWQDRIAHILEETGADKINLVAQSMGGLDARYLISERGYHEVVASLVTIATPHRGTAIAEIMLKQPERLRKWGIDFANWMGSQSLKDTDADTLQALTELSPAYVQETFNTQVPDHPSVRYWSYAGAAGKDTDIPINPFLKLSNTLLYAREGRNDGLVSVESAKWGTFVEVIEADHAQQVGIPGLTTHAFDANAFYCSVVERLHDEGF
jgi:triacylglycerol lipase